MTNVTSVHVCSFQFSGIMRLCVECMLHINLIMFVVLQCLLLIVAHLHILSDGYCDSIL